MWDGGSENSPGALKAHALLHFGVQPCTSSEEIFHTTCHTKIYKEEKGTGYVAQENSPQERLLFLSHRKKIENSQKEATGCALQERSPLTLFHRGLKRAKSKPRKCSRFTNRLAQLNKEVHLGVCTGDISRHSVLCWEGAFGVHIPGLHPLGTDRSRCPIVTAQNISGYCQCAQG